LFGGGGGLVSTAADYWRFAEMLRRGGELDGSRILGACTVAYMTQNNLPEVRDLASLATPGSFSETRYEGIGFGRGVSVVIDPVRAQVPCSAGEYGWRQVSTAFWVSPAEVVFMTQLQPSTITGIPEDQRLREHAEDPGTARPWAEVRAAILSRQ